MRQIGVISDRAGLSFPWGLAARDARFRLLLRLLLWVKMSAKRNNYSALSLLFLSCYYYESTDWQQEYTTPGFKRTEMVVHLNRDNLIRQDPFSV